MTYRFCDLAAGVGLMALMLASGTAAMAQAPAAPPAPAADPASPPAEAETIVITGSRIARNGFSTPTPVTVMGQDRVSALAITNVADALNQLPSFRASSGPANQTSLGGNVGARVLDLRSLGAARTLVLVDGRRFVPSTSEGTVDVNLIPSGLVQRTEVVTGGASAVYGSDAVAGVVNFILDRKFTGFKAEIQGGTSQRGDDTNQFASFTAGTRIGERGHITLAGEYENNEGLAGCYEARAWCAQERSIVGNTPAGSQGQPSSIITSDVHPSTVSPGGLINRSLNAAGQPIYSNVALDPLRGIKFLSNGTPAPFVYGQFAGPLFMIGGDNHGQNPYLSSLLLKVPVERYSLYSSASYELTDTIRANLDLSFGQVRGTTLSSTFRDFNGSLIGNLKADNPFLPASIAQTMAANNIAQLTFGRSGFDLGSPKAVSTTKTYRAVASLEGSIGSGWKWDAYYQYGRTDFHQAISNDPVNSRMRKAFDAVRLGNGSIVCRVNADAITTNDDAACVPINLIGENQFSAAARAYVIGSGYQDTRNTQQVAAFNVSGDLFTLWQDKAVSLSLGGEWRRNTIKGSTDPLSAVNDFWVLNGQATTGKQTVKEVYAETVVPLLSDLSFARTLEANGAVRYTDYSDSGSVVTWKVGGIYEPVRELRFRVTRSRDIRAPNLSELHGPQQKTTIGLTDPLTGLQANPVTIRGSNPNLGVEKADSLTAGVVISPSWGFLSRLRISADYFKIKVVDAIGQLGAQTLVQRCVQGATEFCPLIVRDGSNTVIQVSDVLLNANAVKTRGFDLEADYRQPLGSLGQVSLRMLATIVQELTTTDSAGSLDRAGQIGSRAGTVLGVPDYTLDGLVTYTKGRGTLTFHGRYIPGGSYNVSFIGPDDPRYAVTLPTSVNNNRIPGRFYMDLAGSYKLRVGNGRDFELFGSINNLFDRDPPAMPSGNLGTNQVLFDPIGRAFRVGARVRFGG
jgi:outer membrane receptor protein involved in Fe transport